MPARSIPVKSVGCQEIPSTQHFNVIMKVKTCHNVTGKWLFFTVQSCNVVNVKDFNFLFIKLFIRASNSQGSVVAQWQ